MPNAQGVQAHKQQQAKKPEPVNIPKEHTVEPAQEALLLGHLAAEAAAAPGDPPNQAALLQDERLQPAQRQALARQAGKLGGNQFLQRAIAHTGMVQREGETQTLPERLREAMEGIGTDEEAIFGALTGATAADKAAVLADAALMAEIRDELSGEELLRALTLLGAPLADRLRVAMGGAGTDEAAIFSMLGSASAPQKAAVLADAALMAEIRDEMSGEELLQALTLLGAPLAQKLNVAMEGIGTDEAMIQSILTSAPAAERSAALADPAIIAQLFDELSLEDMLLVMNGAGVPFTRILQMAMDPWQAENTIVQGMLQGASAADRTAALADGVTIGLLHGRLTAIEMVTTLHTAGVPLKRIIELALDPWVATLADVNGLVTNASDAECETVWSDTALMTRARAVFGENDYLTFVTAVRMFQPGVTAEDNATHTSAADADEAIQTHLEAYVQGAVEEGRAITGMVAVVGDEDWDRAGLHRYGATVWNGGKRDGINGFVDVEGRVWIHRNRGNAGTMIHEAIHKYSTDDLIHISQPLNEGVTEYFTRQVCAALTPPIEGRGNYQPNYNATVRLVAVTSEATVASAYFDGATDALRDAVVSAKSQEAWDNFITHASANAWADAVADLA